MNSLKRQFETKWKDKAFLFIQALFQESNPPSLRPRSPGLQDSSGSPQAPAASGASFQLEAPARWSTFLGDLLPGSKLTVYPSRRCHRSLAPPPLVELFWWCHWWCHRTENESGQMDANAAHELDLIRAAALFWWHNQGSLVIRTIPSINTIASTTTGVLHRFLALKWCFLSTWMPTNIKNGQFRDQNYRTSSLKRSALENEPPLNYITSIYAWICLVQS